MLAATMVQQRADWRADQTTEYLVVLRVEKMVASSVPSMVAMRVVSTVALMVAL